MAMQHPERTFGGGWSRQFFLFVCVCVLFPVPLFCSHSLEVHCIIYGAGHKNMCILVPKELKEVERQPLLEKRHSPHQCLPHFSPALALLSAWMTSAVLSEQSCRGKPMVLLRENLGNVGVSTQLGWL